MASTLKQEKTFKTPGTRPRAPIPSEWHSRDRRSCNYISRVFWLDFHLQPTKQDLPQVTQGGSTAGEGHPPPGRALTSRAHTDAVRSRSTTKPPHRVTAETRLCSGKRLSRLLFRPASNSSLNQMIKTQCRRRMLLILIKRLHQSVSLDSPEVLRPLIPPHTTPASSGKIICSQEQLLWTSRA